MVQTISKELSAWLGEVKEQGRFRGRLAELFSEFGKGQDKPIDRELNAISEALGVSKFMALATLLVEGYIISGEEEIKPKYFEVDTGEEKIYRVPNKGLVLMPKIIGDTAGYSSKITEEEMEGLDEHDKQFAKQV
jgi:hypothetical protein